jgi:hypothetical protein
MLITRETAAVVNGDASGTGEASARARRATCRNRQEAP